MMTIQPSARLHADDYAPARIDSADRGVYLGNNPTNATDPSGLDKVVDFLDIPQPKNGPPITERYVQWVSDNKPGVTIGQRAGDYVELYPKFGGGYVELGLLRGGAKERDFDHLEEKERWAHIKKAIYIIRIQGTSVPPHPESDPTFVGPKLPPDNFRYFGRYYPSQAYDLTTRKVALITNNTPKDDTYSWIPKERQYKIDDHEAMRRALRRYADDSIDVLVLSGHTGERGGQALVLTRREHLIGGIEMPGDIDALIRKKLSSTGVIIVSGCNSGSERQAGDKPGIAAKTADLLGFPVVVTEGCAVPGGFCKEYAGGGASTTPWVVVAPLKRHK